MLAKKMQTIILLSLTALVYSVGEPQMILRFTRIAQCKGKGNLSVYVPPWSLEQKSKNNFYMTGQIILREDFLQGFKLNMDVKKCKDSVNSCDPFMNNVATKNFCQLLNTKSPLYAEFFHAFNPKVVCPLRKGVFNLTEFKQDDTLLKYMPGTGLSYWHATFKGTVQNNEILCFDIDLNIRPKRMHSQLIL